MKAHIKRFMLLMPAAAKRKLFETPWLPGRVREFFYYRYIDHSKIAYRKAIERFHAKNPLNIRDTEFDSVKAISFDFYDTLFSRLAVSPRNIFFYIGYILKREGLVKSETEFVKARDSAELSARQSTLGIDVGITSIYDAMVRRQLYPRAVAERALNLETRIEEKVLVIRAHVAKIANTLKSGDRKLLIVSDTYMNSAFLRTALKKSDIDKLFDGIYASSDVGLRKDSGKIWPEVVGRELDGVPKSLLHIGDNAHSDGDSPRGSGVRSRVLPNTRDAAIGNGYPISLNFSTSEQCWVDGILLGPAVAKAGNDPFSCETLKSHNVSEFDFGYMVFGPIAMGFVSWLSRVRRAHGIKKLYFCSRGGYFLKEIFDAVSKEIESSEGVQTEYLLISRKSIVPAAMFVEYNPQRVTRGHYRGTFDSLLKNRLGISASDKIPRDVLQQNVEFLGESEVVTHLLNTQRDVIESLCAASFKNARAYLSAISFESTGCAAIVDVGYSGTIQEALQTVLGYGISGYYFLITPVAKRVRRLGGQAFSFFGDGGRGAKFMPVEWGHMLIEGVFAGPHGQVAGYDSSGAPIFKSTPDIGNEEFELLRAVAAGMTQYCLDLVRAYGPEVLTLPFRSKVCQLPLSAVRDGRIELPARLKHAISVEDEFSGQGSIVKWN